VEEIGRGSSRGPSRTFRGIKHKRHGENVQVLTDAKGRLLYIDATGTAVMVNHADAVRLQTLRALGEWAHERPAQASSRSSP